MIYVNLPITAIFLNINLKMKKYLIFRILGNDLSGLHGNNQTLQNLEFTLKNEKQFPNTEKVYLLNKIYDNYKKTKIERLLLDYNCKYI